MSKADEALERDDVCDMDGQTELVGVAAHQLVREEEGDERDPVAQEELAATQQEGGQGQGHDHDIGRHADSPNDHQDRENDDVAGHGCQKQTIVSPPQMSMRLGSFAGGDWLAALS